MLATVALMIGVTGGAFAEEQHWGNRGDTDGAYTQRYERNWWNYPRNYRRNDSYRDRDGDRDDQGYWREPRHDYRDQDQSRHDRDRGRGRD
jgi:hypothetical protein